MILLWVYYSSVIFLLGAEFTRAYSVRYGSRSDLASLVGASSPARSLPTQSKGTIVTTNGLIVLSLVAVAWATALMSSLMLRRRNR